MTSRRKFLLLALSSVALWGLYWITQTTTKTQTSKTSEEQRINTWIESNQLNEYGEPGDTNYPGGTPLFNESTGQNENRFHYILRQHPDKPWDK